MSKGDDHHCPYCGQSYARRWCDCAEDLKWLLANAGKLKALLARDPFAQVEHLPPPVTQTEPITPI